MGRNALVESQNRRDAADKVTLGARARSEEATPSLRDSRLAGEHRHEEVIARLNAERLAGWRREAEHSLNLVRDWPEIEKAAHDSAHEHHRAAVFAVAFNLRTDWRGCIEEYDAQWRAGDAERLKNKVPDDPVARDRHDIAERRADELLRGVTWSLDDCTAALWQGARSALTGRGAGRKPIWNFAKGSENVTDDRHAIIAQHRSTCSAVAVARMVRGNRGVDVERGAKHAAFVAALRSETVNPIFLAQPVRPKSPTLRLPSAESCAVFAVVVRRLVALVDAVVDDAAENIKRGRVTEEGVAEMTRVKERLSDSQIAECAELFKDLSLARAVGNPKAADSFLDRLLELLGARPDEQEGGE